MKRILSIISTLAVVAVLSVWAIPTIAQAVIPTISIVSVDPGKTVTIQTQNFPANDTFDVLMGQIGTRGVGGVVVGTVNSGAGGAQNFTLNIPAQLQSNRQVAIRLQSSRSGYFSYNWFWNTTGNSDPGIPTTGDPQQPGSQPGSLPPGTIPTINITSVDPGKTVTVQTVNYPANDTFDVLMGQMGTRGIGGIKVDTVSSGTGGSQTFTFNIPAELQNNAQIAIRLQSARTGYFSFNFFTNQSAGIPTTGNPSQPGTQPGTLPPGTVPTIAIVGVDPGKSVQIRTNNYPANNSFEVYMGQMGTQGIGGIKVDTVNSGTGGTQTFTFNIPAELQSNQQIAIRLQAPATGYFSYNWFWNTAGANPGIPTTGNPTQPGTNPGGVIPTITITRVVRDGTVTVQTANFPANDSFEVLMGTMGTQGVGGTRVDTISSGAGGAQTFTFNIPEALKGQQQIAIRLHSPTSGSYVYNWFWNNTTP